MSNKTIVNLVSVQGVYVEKSFLSFIFTQFHLMAEIESKIETGHSQGQPKTEEQDVWNEWPRFHEQRLLIAAQRERSLQGSTHPEITGKN